MHSRLGCFASHVLNLVVEAFFYGSDKDLMLLALVDRPDEEDIITVVEFERELESWRT